MGDESLRDDGNIVEIPWATVFDPAVNVRALTAIQARGFRAASEVIGRFVRPTDSPGASEAQRRNDPDTAPHGSEQSPELTSLFAMWEPLVERFLQSVRPNPAAGLVPMGNGITLGMADGNAVATISIEITSSRPAGAEVWVHNGSTDDVGEIVLRCSDLHSHDREVVPAEDIHFAPQSIEMPARCSRGITMEIRVEDGTPAGEYRGTVVVDGYPGVSLPVVLTVG